VEILCASILTEYRDVDDPFCAHVFSRTCSLAPTAVQDWSVPIRLAKPALAKGPDVAWHLFALAAAEFRAGQPAEAVAQLEKSLAVHPSWIGRGQSYAMLALANRQLGREDDARQWLARTRMWLEEINQIKAKNRFGYAASDYLIDWLSAQVLLAEAEAVMKQPHQ
jgi:tetratricopeptide (TPR) repeat protein